MKRFWLGVAILLVLLLIGIGMTWFMNHFHEQLSRDLTEAAEAAAKGDWETALAHAHQAEDAWQWGKRAVAAIADHEPLEQVDNVFAQLRVYEQLRLPGDYAVTCVHLSELTRALGESHDPKWWNLL